MSEQNIELRDGRELKLTITEEGLILDVYAENEKECDMVIQLLTNKIK